MGSFPRKIRLLVDWSSCSSRNRSHFRTPVRNSGCTLNVYARTAEYYTPLHIAAVMGQADAVMELLKVERDVFRYVTPPPSALSPLACAIKYRKAEAEIILIQNISYLGGPTDDIFNALMSPSGIYTDDWTPARERIILCMLTDENYLAVN